MPSVSSMCRRASAGRRALVLVPLAAALTLGLASCVGQTDAATKISTISAQLNAHGYTNDGPATWWWEYDTVKAELGTASDTEVCGYPPEADRRCGPASGGSQSNQIPVSVTVTKLTPNTTYYFRACGQDLNDANPGCGSTLSFKTLAGTSYAYDSKWGTPGTGNGQFDEPWRIATDIAGNVYVGENGQNPRIQKFTPAGGFITKWGGSGTAGELDGVAGLATDAAGSVYATDQGSTIQKFTSSGTFVKTLTSCCEPYGYFQGVATDASGNVYVTELGPSEENDRVQKFSSTGSYVGQWGSEGTANGQFANAHDIAVDPAGNVYVADTDNYRTQKFTSSGTFLTKWGINDGRGAQYGIGTDSASRVYAADIDDGQVVKFSSSGALLATWPSASAPNPLLEPGDVASDPFGNIYVADTSNDRIQKFKPIQ